MVSYRSLGAQRFIPQCILLLPNNHRMDFRPSFTARSRHALNRNKMESRPGHMGFCRRHLRLKGRAQPSSVPQQRPRVCNNACLQSFRQRRDKLPFAPGFASLDWLCFPYKHPTEFHWASGTHRCGSVFAIRRI